VTRGTCPLLTSALHSLAPSVSLRSRSSLLFRLLRHIDIQTPPFFLSRQPPFGWYAEAVVCLVYLEDCAASRDGFSLQAAGCRWFSRGGTSQELIAPVNVIFYNSSSEDMGTKKSLTPVLSDITRIDRRLLLGEKSLSDYSVAQRMSWASGRQTTRTEDRAYALRGNFNVHMPLLYDASTLRSTRCSNET